MQTLLDTRDAPTTEVYPWWLEEGSRLFFPLEGRAQCERPFRGRVTGGALGMVRVFAVAGDANECRRPDRGSSPDDGEHLAIHLMRRGACGFAQSDRAGLLEEGDLTVCDGSRPFVMHAPGSFEMLTFAVPRSLLGTAADRLASRTALRVPAEDGAARLVGPFLTSVADDLDGLPGGDAAQELAAGVAAMLRTLYATR
jgi:hypothetical protein